MVETNKKKMQKIAMKSMKIHQEVSYFLIFLSPHSLSTPSSAKPPFNCHRHYDGAKMNQQSRPWFPKYGEQNWNEKDLISRGSLVKKTQYLGILKKIY